MCMQRGASFTVYDYNDFVPIAVQALNHNPGACADPCVRHCVRGQVGPSGEGGKGRGRMGVETEGGGFFFHNERKQRQLAPQQWQLAFNAKRFTPPTSTYQASR